MTPSTPHLERRRFLQTAGLGSLAAIGLSASPQGAELSAGEQANVKLVTDFCAAWATRDLAKILPFLSDDCVYRMSETAKPAAGHAGVTERLGTWLQTSDRIEFNVLDTFAKGPMVINHRVDRFISTKRPLTWEGVGVFFVKDGRIKEWSDYSIRSAR